MTPNMQTGFAPLAGVRVLGVTVFLAGPFTIVNLARLGAEAIKVEIPKVGDPVRQNGPFVSTDGYHGKRPTEDCLSTRFLKRNQGLKSVTLNLKDPEGRNMFLEMAKTCDVVVENLSPGSMNRMGLGYQQVSQVNPQVIFCSISGYGQTGPNAGKPAQDPQIQGMSGIMDINGEPNGPPTRVGFYISDLVTPMFACYSIVAAMRERDRTGLGQYLDVSMMDTLTSLMFMENLEEAMETGEDLRQGNNVRGAPMGVYQASDGEVTITVASDDQWRRVAEAFDAPDLLKNRDFVDYVSRSINVKAARLAIQKLVSCYTRNEVLVRLERHDVPCGPVRTVADAVGDTHFWERGTLRPLRQAGIPGALPGVGSGFPVTFSGGPLPDQCGAPTLGMHNLEVYQNLLGLCPADLDILAEKGII